MEVKLKSGDIVIDVVTNDVGLLVQRYCLFDPLEIDDGSGEPIEEAELTLWAWDIYWAGPDASGKDISRYQPYTEEGLTNLVKTGTFILKSCD